MNTDVFIVSVEASGDDLAVDVIKSLRTHRPDLTIRAVGGPALSRVGLSSPFDVSVLSILGYAEALKAYPQVVKLADAVAEHIIEANPKSVVLVDAWGFSIRLGDRLRKRAPHIRLIKLIGPQVWATRAGRAKTLAKHFDELLCIHDFEVPFYKDLDIECTVIGNPALSRVTLGDGRKFRDSHGISDSEELVLLLPGSRASEIRRVAPTLANAASILAEQRGDKTRFCVLVSPNISTMLHAAHLNWPANSLFVENAEEKTDLMAAADLALACSGTVTSELAVQGCPMIIGYRLDPITFFVAKSLLYKARFFTLANVAMDEAIVPEFLQDEFTAEEVARLGAEMLDKPEIRDRQKQQLKLACERMGWGDAPAHEIAAGAILKNL